MGLLNFYLRKSEAFQHAGQRAAGILVGGFEDAVLQRGLLQLTFGFDADFAFEIRIRGREQAGVAGIDAGAGVVDQGAENFGLAVRGR